MRLKSLRVLLAIAAWFDLDLRQFDVSAAYLYGEIDGEIYMEPLPGHGDGDSVRKLLKRSLRPETDRMHLAREAQCRYGGIGIYAMPEGPHRVPDWHSEDGRLAFWVDDETIIGSLEQIGRLADMFRWKYGIPGEGEMRWTLGMDVRRLLQAYGLTFTPVIH